MKMDMERDIEKGRVEATQKALLLLLEKRFGRLSPDTTSRVRRIQRMERLEALLVSVLDVRSLEELDI